MSRRPPHDAGARPHRTEPLWGPNGLAPAIIQDVADGRVLMLAWMDEEAWRVTRETGVVHFHSRTRDRLWRKGETSGHELVVRDVVLDCDADAILSPSNRSGRPAIANTRSCFDADGAPAEPHDPGLRLAGDLWDTIASRAAERRRAPTRRACSTAASTRSVGRSPRRRPRS